MVAAFRTHAGNADVAACLCKTLADLARHLDCLTGIAAAGSVAVLVQALTIHADDADVPIEATCALLAIAALEDSAAPVDASGVVAAMVAALARHARDSSFAWRVGSFLRDFLGMQRRWCH